MSSLSRISTPHESFMSCQVVAILPIVTSPSVERRPRDGGNVDDSRPARRRRLHRCDERRHHLPQRHQAETNGLLSRRREQPARARTAAPAHRANSAPGPRTYQGRTKVCAMPVATTAASPRSRAAMYERMSGAGRATLTYTMCAASLADGRRCARADRSQVDALELRGLRRIGMRRADEVDDRRARRDRMGERRGVERIRRSTGVAPAGIASSRPCAHERMDLCLRATQHLDERTADVAAAPVTKTARVSRAFELPLGCRARVVDGRRLRRLRRIGRREHVPES